MWSRIALTLVALAGLQARAEAGPRAAFVNLARNGDAGAAAIDALRPDVIGAGATPLEDGPVRVALERALDTTATSAPNDEARALLVEARAAYADFRYTDVFDRVRRVDELLTPAAPTGDSVELLAEGHLLAGLAHAGSDAPERALGSFRLVARLQPSRAELDPGRYRPEVVALYQRAVLTEREATGVAIDVVTAPAGARIWLDGRAVGDAPLAIPSVAPGLHYLAATLDGARTDARKVVVEPSAPARIELTPRPLATSERIAQLRREALGAPAKIAWDRVARAVALEVAVDLVILVRQRGDGHAEAAIYDAGRARLGPWTTAPSTAFARALQQLVRSDLLAVGDPTTDRPASTPWYRTWWGSSLLFSGGVAVIGTIFYAVSDRGADRTYTIGDWCIEGDACR